VDEARSLLPAVGASTQKISIGVVVELRATMAARSVAMKVVVVVELHVSAAGG
jgi:hypothetical protein